MNFEWRLEESSACLTTTILAGRLFLKETVELVTHFKKIRDRRVITAVGNETRNTPTEIPSDIKLKFFAETPQTANNSV